MKNSAFIKFAFWVALQLCHSFCVAQIGHTFHVATAGTLPQLISEEEKYQIVELTLTGELNGTDVNYICSMANSGNNEKPEGKLTFLDISNTKIVAGGEAVMKGWYEESSYGDRYVDYYTQDNSISKFFFHSCDKLESIILPNSVTSIDEWAFWSCRDLTSLTIPSANYIDDGAFSYCGGLNSVTIGNNVTSIGGWTFSGCIGLTSIKVESGNQKYDSRNNCNAIIETSSNTLIRGCKNTNIPNSVTTIGSSAFSWCRGLTSVTIPNSVTSIGSSAFSGCTDLTSVTIPNSVTSIGGYAFDDTAWYNNQPNGVVYAGKVAYKYKGEMPTKTSITIKNGTLAIAGLAFYNCNGLTSITIPNSVTSIGSSAFKGCSSLTSITIPNSVTSIGSSAFDNCCGLTSVTLGNGVTSISASVFYDCSGLTYINVGSGNPKYDSRKDCNAIIETSSNILIVGCKNSTIPNSVNIIGDDAFYNCGGLTSITIPNSVTSIGSSAFKGCSSLTSITIPNSVTSIGSSAFDNCSGLTSITIPNSVTSIGSFAFFHCSGLASITTPNSVTSIERDAFSGTAWLNNQPDGLVYAGKVAYKYKGEMADNTHITLKEGTKGIAGYAFSNCNGLSSLTIPNSVESIGSQAFYRCSGLTSITIPSSVTSIGSSAFYNCSGLTSIIIPNSVESIGGDAFYGCSGLTSITIPNSVTTIGDWTFYGCKSLTTITSEIEKPFEISDFTFGSDTYNVAELIVPKGTMALYQATEGWNKFTMITEAPDKDAVAFTIDGISYEGTKSEKTVVVKAVDTKQTSIEIPASVNYDGITYQVSGITDGVFDGSNMAALIWDVEAALPNNAFGNASIGSNFLLYVKSSSYAPSSVKNVIVDGIAQTIVLSDDGGQFYCPQAFTARSISYTHNYSMETGIGKAKGWETIALPFDVQKISHNTRGEIVPFPAYNSSSNQKPFWLANFSGSSFRRTAAVLANEPYIIAMPNSSSYRNEYNLAGDVTFSAENEQVPRTPSFSGTFMPTFVTVAKSSSVYALNVNNRYVKYSGSYDQGSCFISGLRDVRPFEAYLAGNFTRGIIEIGFDDDTTDMLDVLLSTDEAQEVSIHTLSGQQVARTTQRDFDSVWQQLPKGVYIVNGYKRIK